MFVMSCGDPQNAQKSQKAQKNSQSSQSPMRHWQWKLIETSIEVDSDFGSKFDLRWKNFFGCIFSSIFDFSHYFYITAKTEIAWKSIQVETLDAPIRY